MTGQIFISYRRNDSRWAVTSIYNALIKDFPKDQVFMDIDNIPPATDFVEVIEQAVSKCDVMIAVIGKDWLEIKDRIGRRMLDNSSDFVRLEIATALERKIKIIPVLVDDALMPSSEDLPGNLKVLSRINAISISHNRFNYDIDRLIKTLKNIFAELHQTRLALEEELRKKTEQEARQKQIEEEKRKSEELAKLTLIEDERKKKLFELQKQSEERIKILKDQELFITQENEKERTEISFWQNQYQEEKVTKENNLVKPKLIIRFLTGLIFIAIALGISWIVNHYWYKENILNPVQEKVLNPVDTQLYSANNNKMPKDTSLENTVSSNIDKKFIAKQDSLSSKHANQNQITKVKNSNDTIQRSNASLENSNSEISDKNNSAKSLIKDSIDRVNEMLSKKNKISEIKNATWLSRDIINSKKDTVIKEHNRTIYVTFIGNNIYKKYVYAWGGIFYFINEASISEKKYLSAVQKKSLTSQPRF